VTGISKRERRSIEKQLAVLRRERREIVTGRRISQDWWGTPWCSGPGSPGHQQPFCEGCAIRLMCLDQARELDPEIDRLVLLLAPVVEGVVVQEVLW
jgi:hypothetical protein